jgi:ElaA protein
VQNPSLASVPQAAVVRRRWAADLDPATLYALLKLRVDVFVVEQDCAYPELDGRDLESRTRHYWLTGAQDTDGFEPVLGCVRLLKEPDGGYRVGRLCVVKAVRRNGLGHRLMAAVLAEVSSSSDCVLDAQTPHVGFYAAFGFVQIGDPYDWAGVEHVPMRRPRRVAVS